MDDSRTALLTEHLSYTPLSLIDDIINSINNLIYQAISSLEDGLTSAPPEKLGFSHAPDTIPDTDDDGNIMYPQATLEIENGLHQLETLLESTVDKAFDRFEIYVLRNILTVPEDVLGWVGLNHYENLILGEELANAPTQEDITAQRQQLRETRRLQRVLKHEVAKNEAIISQLTSVLEPLAEEANKENEEPVTSGSPPNLSFLTHDPAARALKIGGDEKASLNKPILTNTTFIVSQLPALREMLLQLRGRLSDLPQFAKQLATDIQPDEREEYIDGRIKLHLQRHGGLAPSDDPYSSAATTGKKVDKKELDALDSAVAFL
ncbi:hypothetical protein KEM56_003699 [Ascosphaera pollenicola]|nr:hypothetical protein KEM56_003699 [Ascosphaera pollenicola]